MIKKDAYYFPHDSNAQNDPAIMLIIEQIGTEGVGIFWLLIEILREQQDYKYPLKLISSLARRWNTTKEKVEIVINNYGLFMVDDQHFFFSKELNRRMEIINQKREKFIKAGQKGGLKKAENQKNHSDAKATLKQRHSNALPSKGKEIKEKEIFLTKKQFSNLEIPEEEQMDLKMFLSALPKNFPTLLKFDQPLTGEEVVKLLKTYGKKICEESFKTIENMKGQTDRYKSAYMSAEYYCKANKQLSWKGS